MQDQSSAKTKTTLSTQTLSDRSRARRLLVGCLVALVCLGAPLGAVTGTESAQSDDALGIATVQAQSSTTTGQASNTSASGGSVTLDDQISNGSNVTVANVTLPEGGFVGIHGDGYSYGQTDLSLTTVSRYLEPGTYQNLSIPAANGVPGGYGNISQFNGTQNITARLYTDSNSNQHFDYLLSSDSDRPYRSDDQSVTDNAELVIEGARGSPSWTIPKASVEFSEQTTNGRAIVVDEARLPDGGFLVVRDSSYLPPENETYNSTIGVSPYLKPNETVSDVPIELFNVPGRSMNQTALANNTTLVVQASRDTNGDQSYDYIRSKGIDDQPYVDNSTLVEQRADVTINKSVSVEQTERSQTNETGEPVNVDIAPESGILGKISEIFSGQWVNAFAGAMFLIFVAVFVRRRAFE